MPKKDFKNNTSHLDRFFSGTEDMQDTQSTDNTQDTQSTDNTQDAQSTDNAQSTENTQNTQDTQKPKYYRLNLKLKAEYKEYLDFESWKARKSITQYINDLIEADRISKS